jgi:hypothetical protein
MRGGCVMRLPWAAVAALTAVRGCRVVQARVCVVTGAAGFVGRYTVRHLLQTGDYDEVRAVDLVLPAFTERQVVSRVVDIAGEGPG